MSAGKPRRTSTPYRPTRSGSARSAANVPSNTVRILGTATAARQTSPIVCMSSAGTWRSSPATTLRIAGASVSGARSRHERRSPAGTREAADREVVDRLTVDADRRLSRVADDADDFAHRGSLILQGCAGLDAFPMARSPGKNTIRERAIDDQHGRRTSVVAVREIPSVLQWRADRSKEPGVTIAMSAYGRSDGATGRSSMPNAIVIWSSGQRQRRAGRRRGDRRAFRRALEQLPEKISCRPSA